MGLTLVTPAATYPVTLAEARMQCRIDASDTGFDTELEALIAAATDYVENYTGRAIIDQTWMLTLDKFSDSIMLPRGPVQSITSVKYYDTDGVLQTLSTAVYTLDASDPAWLVRNATESWPTVLDGINAVQITYLAGYANVPASLKHAVMLLVGHWLAEKEGSTPVLDMLLCNHRAFG